MLQFTSFNLKKGRAQKDPTFLQAYCRANLICEGYCLP